MIENLIPLLLSLIFPLILIPFEMFLPIPYLIEELAKLFIVFLIFRQEREDGRNYFMILVTCGVFFTLSETMFYLINIFALGNLLLIPSRLALTGCLHVGTIGLIYLFGKKGGWMLVLGFVAAMLIHFGYNYWIGLLIPSLSFI
jgi:hypothetical protein